MSTPGPEASAPFTPSTPAPSHSLRRHIEEFVLIALVFLSGIGVAINNYSPQSAFRYWIWMAPTFGTISVAAAWYRAQRRGESVPIAIQRQVLHWGGVVGAVYLVYLLQSTGRITNEAAGLSALIIIALASFLAGVHSDWRLMLLGMVLGGTVAGLAILDRIIWIIALPVMAIMLAVLVFYVWRARARA